MKKFTAFTLSEILVTVGIIGVISALTIPNLVKNYQKEAMTVQLRKVVTEIESAIDMLITEEGKTSLASTSIAKDGGIDDFIKTHFKTIKTCSSNKTNECFANENYISINGNGNKSFKCSGNSYILANSASICANKVTEIPVNVVNTPIGGITLSESNKFKNVNGINIELFIDTNGNQAPNIGGRDMFHVYIQPDGRIYDEANSSDIICEHRPTGNVCLMPGSQTEIKADCSSQAFGTGCFAKIIASNWKMDY